MRRHGIGDDVVTVLAAVSRAYRGWGGSAPVSAGCTTAASWSFAGAHASRSCTGPGHSPSDTVLFDPAAGDAARRRPPDQEHLLEPADLRAAGRGAERAPARAADATWRRCARRRRCRVATVLPGHGDAFGDHAALIEERFAMHERRARKIARADRRAAAHRARDRARHLGQRRGHAGLPHAVSEVLGHIDLLVERGEVVETEDDGVVRVDDVELILTALLVSVVVLAAAARAINVPYPIVLVIGGGGARAAAARAARDRARPGPRARDLPAAAALLGRVLRQPARPAREPAADHAAVDRARAGHDGRRRGRGARADRRAVVAGGVRAGRDRRADRPGRGDGDRAPPRRPAAGSSPCSRASRWSTTRPRSWPTTSRSRAATGAWPSRCWTRAGTSSGRPRAGSRSGSPSGWVIAQVRAPARRPAGREHDRPADAPTPPTCPPSTCTSRRCWPPSRSAATWAGRRRGSPPPRRACRASACGSCCSS